MYTLYQKNKSFLESALALAVYCVIAVLLYGREIIFNINYHCLRCSVADAKQFIWFLNWWPFALSHHLNLFITNYVWAPTGFNLAQATSVPALSFLMMPITLAFGPIISFNIIAIFSGAVTAWTTYILCKHLTKAFLPSLLGGYFSGFSCYQYFFNGFGDINLTSLFLIPLLLYLSLLYFEKKIKRAHFIFFSVLALVSQFLISIEIFTTLALFGLFLWLLAYFICKGQKEELLQYFKVMRNTYIITAIIVSPYIYYFIKTPVPSYFMHPLSNINDLVSLYLPQILQIFNLEKFNFNAPHFGPGYIGIPTLLITIFFAKEFWNTKKGKLITLFFGLATIASLGYALQVNDINTNIPLISILFFKIPFLQHALPNRFILYSFFAISIIVAFWLSSQKGKNNKTVFLRYALVLIAIASIIPITANNYWSKTLPESDFFKTGMYKKFIKPNSIVLFLPYGVWGDDMTWELKTNMYFRSNSGFVSAFAPKEFSNNNVVEAFYYTKPIDDNVKKEFPLFIAQHKTATILVGKKQSFYWQPLLDTLGIKPEKTAENKDFYVYEIAQ